MIVKDKTHDLWVNTTFYNVLETNWITTKKFIMIIVVQNKKCSSKGSPREYVVPHEFIRQQRAYYKEIDEYELEVEEVE